ncbi:MAG TPA: hypothetical protein VHV78_15735 [Gemmatimonadaceae bacterium]|jgi:hypothetical protein|nr:hypothetical protein [Gemmatimonadaceae bacterium]
MTQLLERESDSAPAGGENTAASPPLSAPCSVPSGAPIDFVDAPDADGSIFSLLARQARTRGTSDLWITAAGGAMNAALVWYQYPKLHWLAAGFAAVAAYGVWGVADRALAHRRDENAGDGIVNWMLIGTRSLAIPVGLIAALGAAGAFMAAALGGWQH